MHSDNFDSMTINLRDSANGTFVTSDDSSQLTVSGDLVMALPCASAKRSRLLLEVFDDCSSVCRRLSLRERRAFFRDVNKTVFARNLLETGGVVVSESCEDVEHRPCITCNLVVSTL